METLREVIPSYSTSLIEDIRRKWEGSKSLQRKLSVKVACSIIRTIC